LTTAIIGRRWPPFALAPLLADRPDGDAVGDELSHRQGGVARVSRAAALRPAGYARRDSDLPVYLWRRLRAPDGGEWTREELPALFLLGVAGVGLNQLFFVTGLARTSVAHASLLMGMTPVLVLVMATSLGQEKLRARKLVGWRSPSVGSAS